MRKKITISLTQESIQNAINQIEAYKNTLAEKTREFIERLAEVGISTIEENMVTPGDSSPERNAYVRLNSYGTYAKADLVLQGRDILFIEFGAGIHYNGAVGSAAYPKAAELGYTIGSYGHGQGANDFWFYTDETGASHQSFGTKASMPMYKADQKIIRQVRKIAKEVFRW